LPPGAFRDPSYHPSLDATAPVEPLFEGDANESVLPTPQSGGIEFPADGQTDALPAPATADSLEPLSATQIPSAEFQFGVAGRRGEVQAMIADGQLRRLPAVTPATNTAVIGKVRVARLFKAPTADSQPVRTAELPSETPVRR
jgi:hypothetical protein